ncbi:hypothetical protein C8A00DRAFT_35804 [Chaetomidium leptoderma]|uniref:Uncharacterized protein n=1 Tax=Chaetomidium leptoderma TaxID=669021 RepID=A0AAN6ZV89_9PEZI|nr:hypothetical protein C8A00DRAFT_35804 [Chaetomidium leptoderma]
MKYTTVLLTLVAVATAASLPSTDTPNAIAQDDSDQYGNSPDDEELPGLEKRIRKYRGGKHNNTQPVWNSTASSLTTLNVGVLVAGLAGGVGAVFL